MQLSKYFNFVAQIIASLVAHKNKPFSMILQMTCLQSWQHSQY